MFAGVLITSLGKCDTYFRRPIGPKNLQEFFKNPNKTLKKTLRKASVLKKLETFQSVTLFENKLLHRYFWVFYWLFTATSQ